MHVPKIWPVWYNRENWWTMHPSVERCQRKNLRFSLVLVHLVGCVEQLGADISFSCSLGISNPDVSVESTSPISTLQRSWIGVSKMSNRRLVYPCSSQQKHWPSRLQRTNLRSSLSIRRKGRNSTSIILH